MMNGKYLRNYWQIGKVSRFLSSEPIFCWLWMRIKQREDYPMKKFALGIGSGSAVLNALVNALLRKGFSIAVGGKKRSLLQQKKFDGRVEASLIALAVSVAARRCAGVDFAPVSRAIGRVTGTREHLARECSSIAQKNQLKPWQVNQRVIAEANAD